MPATAAISSATASGVVPSHPRNETCTSWVFCAMNTMSRRSSNPNATIATKAPLVRDRRNGSFGFGLDEVGALGGVGEPGFGGVGSGPVRGGGDDSAIQG